jgi:hypothetical protein
MRMRLEAYFETHLELRDQPALADARFAAHEHELSIGASRASKSIE